LGIKIAPGSGGCEVIRSELIRGLAVRYGLPDADAEKIVAAVLDAIAASLVLGQRVELRGFGSFSVNKTPSRKGRNPRSGAPILINEKWHLHFRAGKELRGRLNGL
jgi:integration host factor subunit beta